VEEVRGVKEVKKKGLGTRGSGVGCCVSVKKCGSDERRESGFRFQASGFGKKREAGNKATGYR
jgi:hypothetical protein